MRRIFRLAAFLAAASATLAAQSATQWPDPTQQQSYTWHLVSSAEATGGNADYRTVTPGQTLTIFDADGPGVISHIWFTIGDPEPYHLKRIVLRMYWDGEDSPSVETPIGDFFGLGFGEYFNWHSELLSVGNSHALNSFFQMPFQKHARITITNDGKMTLSNLYFNIEYRSYPHPLPAGTLYFHAQYRQAQPNHGWTNQWSENGDPLVNYKRNLDGKDNYVWFVAKGRGQFIGVTMSILQNQDGWWGEGDPMFFIDDPDKPQLPGGTGSEDYFLGAWDFGGASFAYPLYGAPVVGRELAGERWAVYRFHLDSPITFTKYMKATIEHGHANDRSDNFYSVAYWYQTEPHAPFPPLPSMDDRIPTLEIVGGPGNAGASQPQGGLSPK
jgi:hypothetical protein